MREPSSDDLAKRLCPPRRRYLLAILLGLGCFFFYSTILCFHDAHHLQIAHADPVNASSSYCRLNRTGNEFESLVKKPYKWNAQIEAYIRISYSVSHFVFHIVGAALLMKCSPKKLLGFSVLGVGLFTVMIPWFLFGTYDDYITMITARFLIGMAGGIAFPAVHAILSCWTPRRDRGKLSAIVFSMFHLAAAFALEFSAFIAKKTGDPKQIYYAFSGCAFAWFAVWMFLGKSNYEEDVAMTVQERNYMKREMGPEMHFHPTKIPWKQMAKSVPLWALCVASTGYGIMWQVTLFGTRRFMRYVLNHDMKLDYRHLSFPHELSAALILVIGFLSDWAINNGHVMRTTERKLCMTIGAMGPAIFLVTMTYSGCNEYKAHLVLTVAISLTGFYFTSSRVNTLDLAPNFSGPVMGVSHAMEVLPGIYIPYIVSLLDEERSTIWHWRICYWCLVLAVTVTTLVFVLFGTAEVQPWNHVDDDSKKVTYEDDIVSSEEEYSLEGSGEAAGTD